MVTGTGHPGSVARTATEAGFEVTALAAYRDHHWFSAAEAAREARSAEHDRARVLLTAKDAVRWPLADDPLVLEVAWRWVCGGGWNARSARIRCRSPCCARNCAAG